jgi:hypothetical protein
MAELADAPALGAGEATRVGSNPSAPTKKMPAGLMNPALTVTCPRCASAPRRSCKQPNGQTLGTRVHGARLQQWGVVNAVQKEAPQAPLPRIATERDRCPFCRRMDFLEESAFGPGTKLTCYNPPCVYVRTAAKSAAIREDKIICLRKPA